MADEATATATADEPHDGFGGINEEDDPPSDAPWQLEDDDGFQTILGRPLPTCIQAANLQGDYGLGDHQPGHIRGPNNTWYVDHSLGQFG